jgi:hypothetical protein
MREEVAKRLEKKELMQEERLLSDQVIESTKINYVKDVLTKNTNYLNVTQVGSSAGVKDPVTQMIDQVWKTASTGMAKAPEKDKAELKDKEIEEEKKSNETPAKKDKAEEKKGKK